MFYRTRGIMKNDGRKLFFLAMNDFYYSLNCWNILIFRYWRSVWVAEKGKAQIGTTIFKMFWTTNRYVLFWLITNQASYTGFGRTVQKLFRYFYEGVWPSAGCCLPFDFWNGKCLEAFKLWLVKEVYTSATQLVLIMKLL